MIVYKKSYNTGQLPDDWKLALVQLCPRYEGQLNPMAEPIPHEVRPLVRTQFESVFTKEEDLDATMLFPHESTYQKMTDINITQHGIQKMLENLNPHKTTGPDDICPLFLKIWLPA